jgi:KDO2-lipid IV(A) lauroyltransferase
MFAFKLLSYLPLSVLYLFADFLYFLAYYILKYRRSVVMQNLKNSFPEKTPQELKAIEKKFYKHLAELFVETIKILSLSKENLEKRFVVTNIDILTKRLAEGKTVLVLTAHLFNWEWLSLITSTQQPYTVYFVYQELSNKFFDKLMLKIRTRFGGEPLKMQNVLKEVIQNHHKARIVALLADQSPAGNEKDHWTEFLHQDTAFFSGAEKIALKLKLPVIFGGATRIKRGHYELYFEEIYHPQEKNEANITENYVRRLEKQIRETPSNWLWSHKRWKKKRNF